MMKRFEAQARTVVIATGIVALSGVLACREPADTAGQGALTSGGHGPLNITFRTDPDPPVAGENRFEVTLTLPNGEPVRDAEVSVMFYMPAMPQMNMPEMRKELNLKATGDGKYTGTGEVTMGGKWEVTVVARRADRQIGTHKLTVVAK